MSEKNETGIDLTEEGIQRIDALVRKANSGDAAALPEVRRILDELPDLGRFLGADLAQNAIDSLLSVIAPDELARQEAIRRQINSMAADLLGGQPTPVERICVERISAAWLHAVYLDNLYAQADDAPASHMEHLSRMQNRANQRLSLAVKTFGTVRRLASPLEVNVNVAASVKTEARQPGIPEALMRRAAMCN